MLLLTPAPQTGTVNRFPPLARALAPYKLAIPLVRRVNSLLEDELRIVL